MLCKRWFFLAVSMLGLCLLAEVSAAGEERQLKEKSIKAGLFYNAIKYSIWPPDAFTKPDDPFQVCLFGGDPFKGALNLQDRSVQRRPINIKSIYLPESAAQCHVVFIGRDEEENLSKIWDVLHDRHILTVSDIERFSEKGGMVELSSPPDEQIRLYLNDEAMQKSGIRARDELLKIAEAK